MGSPPTSAPLLMASGGELIVGATRGSCAGGADLYLGLSADGGKTLRTVELDPKVTAVLAIEVTDKRVVRPGSRPGVPDSGLRES